MGMHVGIVAARTSAARLEEEFFRTWSQYEVIEAPTDLVSRRDLYDWLEAQGQRQSLVFWQDGEWAVLLDPWYAVCADEGRLAALSARLGRVLSLVVESAGGSAMFWVFEGGLLRRMVSNSDGEMATQGEPLPEEIGIQSVPDSFYMDEAEALTAAFGISDFAPPGEYRALSVVDRAEYRETRSAGARELSPVGVAARPAGAIRRKRVSQRADPAGGDAWDTSGGRSHLGSAPDGPRLGSFKDVVPTRTSEGRAFDGGKRKNPKLAGAVLIASGLGLTRLNWYWLTDCGYYYPKVAFIGPLFAVAGVAAMLLPTRREEETARREDVSLRERWARLSPRWRAVAVVAAGLGAANWYLMGRAAGGAW